MTDTEGKYQNYIHNIELQIKSDLAKLSGDLYHNEYASFLSDYVEYLDVIEDLVYDWIKKIGNSLTTEKSYDDEYVEETFNKLNGSIDLFKDSVAILLEDHIKQKIHV